MTQSRYERIGGAAAVRAVVRRLYEKLAVAPRLGKFFAGVNMQKLEEHQILFVAGILGGPRFFTDEGLRRAHATLHIADGDFEQMILLLRETLEEEGLDAEDVGAIVSEMRRCQPFIVAQAA